MTRRPRNLTKQHELEIETRRSIVAANLLAGLKYRDIAKGVGVSLGTIASDVKMVLKRWKNEQVKTADDLVQLEVRRTEVALHAIWKDVQGGKLQAIDRMVSLIKLRATLLGYGSDTTLNVNLNAKDIEKIREKRWRSINKLLPDILTEDDHDNGDKTTGDRAELSEARGQDE